MRTCEANELLEVLSDELRTVVADHPWRHAWVGPAGPLQDGLHVAFLHFFADFPMYDEPTAPIEHGEQEVERAGDVEVTHVDLPVFVRHQWLFESSSPFWTEWAKSQPIVRQWKQGRKDCR